ncbi:MAG: hypothetical protein ACK55I_18480, partial [bacterium]
MAGVRARSAARPGQGRAGGERPVRLGAAALRALRQRRPEARCHARAPAFADPFAARDRRAAGHRGRRAGVGGVPPAERADRAALAAGLSARRAAARHQPPDGVRR